MKRRRLIRVAVLLLLGAIVNVAVAWGCAIWSQARLTTRLLRAPDATDELSWQRRPVQAQAAAPSAVWDFAGFGCWYQLVIGDRTGNAVLRADKNAATLSAFADDLMDRVAILRAGFPMESVDGERWDFGVTLGTALPFPGLPVTKWMSGDIHRSAISIERPRVLGGSSFRMLAWSPIWPGFAINTVFYAAILWMLFFAPFTFRRWRRIRRGQCPACAYPIGSSDVCTECGAELKHKAETQKAEMRT